MLFGCLESPSLRSAAPRKPTGGMRCLSRKYLYMLPASRPSCPDFTSFTARLGEKETANWSPPTPERATCEKDFTCEQDDPAEGTGNRLVDRFRRRWVDAGQALEELVVIGGKALQGYTKASAAACA